MTPWTVACRAPLFMGFPRQEYWSGLLFPSPGDLPIREMETRTDMRYYYIHMSMTKIKKTISVVGKESEQLENSHIAGRNGKMAESL